MGKLTISSAILKFIDFYWLVQIKAVHLNFRTKMPQDIAQKMVHGLQKTICHGQIIHNVQMTQQQLSIKNYLLLMYRLKKR